MAKVVIRSGGDWLTVDVDGKNIIEGHSASPYFWASVFEAAGVDVDYSDNGDFCETCQEWTDDPLKGRFGTICPECKSKGKE